MVCPLCVRLIVRKGEYCYLGNRCGRRQHAFNLLGIDIFGIGLALKGRVKSLKTLDVPSLPSAEEPARQVQV
jgi:hypothetical protein